MKTVVHLLICAAISVLMLVSHAHAKSKVEPLCTTCNKIVSNFMRGLERTKKTVYGGTKTKFDADRVGKKSDSNSELRLIEIMDDICFEANDECPQMIEEHEEDIEKFWFNPAFERSERAFHKYFCIESAKACCPNNTYGPTCEECRGGKERPCSGNGLCDGEGTREGTGKCFCRLGYQGDLCESCTERYYEYYKNETHTFCDACHKACQTSCTGDRPRDCADCKEGWAYKEELGCRDVNECLHRPCEEKEYCNNTEGSYTCLSCSRACGECYGPGHSKCRFCAEGFLRKDGDCFDIDECRSDGHEKLCTEEGQQCENTHGSYTCICEPGYVNDTTGACIREDLVPKEEPEPVETEPEVVDPVPEEVPKKVKKTKKSRPSCSVCKDIATNFMLALEGTKTSNYGGGNTKWEESRLGRYSDSEMRLVEILEGLCFRLTWECHQIVEEYEELIEEFWFNPAFRKQANVFYIFFCIDNLKACCPNNTFGPECEDCLGGRERPCKDNGICDGVGTREGTGKCNCSVGYTGERCDVCAERYYETFRNENHTKCKACHTSCETSCRGDGPGNCDGCRDGWMYNADTGCQDIDECADKPCAENEWCYNTEGTYSCQSCHVSCRSCQGPSHADCKWCSDGFLRNNTYCLDIDECESYGHAKLCPGEGQQCANTPGSFTCICQPRYVLASDGSCIPDPEGTVEADSGPEAEETVSAEAAHESAKDAPRVEL